MEVKTLMSSCLLLLFPYLLFSQTVQHDNIWTRFTVMQTIKEKYKWQAEFQHRRQNNFFDDNQYNPFNQSLMTSVRIWGTYKLSQQITIGISPFAYFWNSSIIQKSTDVEKPMTQEMRWAFYVEMQQSLAKKWNLAYRNFLEYRDFQKTTDDILRWRNRVALNYLPTSKLSFSLFDELFVHLKGATSAHFLDHNRVGLLANYQIIKPLRLELGWLHANRLPRTSSSMIKEDNFIFHVYYTLPTFKK